MKRQFLLLVALLVTAMTANAQSQSATLEQGSTLTTYYGPGAFISAYEAAKNGAVITLSAGDFDTVKKIEKSITIIGCGGFPSFGKYTQISTIYNGNGSYRVHFAIEASNVKLEGLYMYAHVFIGDNYSNSQSISNLKISNCYISTLYSNWKHLNTVIDQCHIISIYDSYYTENLCIKNSYIMEFSGSGTGSSNPAYITNCIIPIWYYSYYDGNSFGRYPPTAVYKNCILGYSSYDSGNLNSTSNSYYQGYYIYNAAGYSNHEYYNNVFYYYPYRYTRGATNSNSYSENSVSASDSLKRVAIRPPSASNTCISQDNVGVSYNNLFNFNTSKGRYDSTYIKVDAKGDDGKPVGLYGGTGFSLYPDIPRIKESKIDSNTDEEGKLNVKIKVETNK
ncbi:MAG: hypothetical protein IJ551_08925 [Prevotella sp.]|nr:hypothetical protein [Prevotella sp.]